MSSENARRLRFDRNQESVPDVEPPHVAHVEMTRPVGEDGDKIMFPLDQRRFTVGFSCSHINLRTGVDGMSRRHVTFELKDGRWWLSDGGSTNGTRRNGERVGREPQPLAEGDRLELGPNHDFVFHAAPLPAAR